MCRSKSLADAPTSGSHCIPIVTTSPALTVPTVRLKLSHMELLQLAPSGLDDTPVNGPPLQLLVRLPERLTVPDGGVAAKTAPAAMDAMSVNTTTLASKRTMWFMALLPSELNV